MAETGGLTQRQRNFARRVLIDGVLIAPTVTHGLASSYSNNGCRCEPCRRAHTARMLELRNARYAKTAANGGIAPVSVHRSTTYANWGCRCAACVTDWNSKANANAKRRQSAA